MIPLTDFCSSDKPALPALPVSSLTAEAAETQDVLESHYLELQHKLLSSVDRQVNTIQEKLNENDLVLTRTEEEKKTIGVNLYKSNVLVGRLNEDLAFANKKCQKLDERCRAAESERDAMKLELKAMNEYNLTCVTHLNTTKQRLEESTDKAAKLSDINLAYNSDIKIHRRIESKIKNELQYVDQRRRVAEEDVEDQKKITEKLMQNRNEMELIMEAQKQETGIANQTIAKMHQEINALKADRKIMQKQWEECMTAMSKRDLTFQSVEKQKEDIKENLDEREVENRSLKNELAQTMKNFTMKELECKGLEDKIQFLHSSLRTLEAKQQETRGTLVEVQVAESLYKQELGKVNKQHTVAKEELERKSSTISDLRGKLHLLKDDFDLKMRNEVIQQAARKEELFRAQAQAEMENAKREEIGKNTELRQENAEYQMQLRQKDEKMHILAKENESLRKSYTEINTHYNRLYDEARHLMYDLERTEHDANYLKAKVQDLTENDPTIPLQTSMSKLQKDKAAVQSENDNLQKMWLEAQKQILKSKNEIIRITDDNVYLRTQLGITDTIKIKTSGEIERAKNREFEQKLEYSKLYAEFRKLQPLVDEYKQKMLTFEEQLIEAKAKIQMEHENSMTATVMLKTEIRRLQAERLEERKNGVTEDRSFQALERKYILAREMVTKLKQERQELQRTCFDLKTKADDMEKRYFDSQLMAKRLAEKAGRSVGEVAARLCAQGPRRLDQLTSSSEGDIKLVQPQSNNLIAMQTVKLPPPMWASIATTPRGSSAQTRTEPLPTDNTDASSSLPESTTVSVKKDLPDYSAWKLKIESLTTERTYLLHENMILKRRIDEVLPPPRLNILIDVATQKKLGVKLSKSERAHAESQQRMLALDKESKAAQVQVKMMSAKSQKAERVAASIEKQYKEARPNVRIDYSLLIEAEPSTQLMAALMFR
ncbi:hypothetical protein HDU98_001995, partial [Podochytrium sp. JEL0797]